MKIKKFPLTHLPEYAMQNALKMIDLPQLIALSLVSRKSKTSVESLNLKGRSITVSLNNMVDIFFQMNGFPNFHCKFYMELIENENRMYQGRLYQGPPSVVVGLYERGWSKEYIWEYRNFEMRDWMNHFRDILHRPKLLSLSFCRGGFDPGNVLDHLQNFRRLNVGDAASNVTGQDIMKDSHRIRELDFPARLFTNEEIPAKILIQNYDYCRIRGNASLKLNDILVCGIKNLKFFSTDITGKELNRFIKLWMRGSNPQLEKFSNSFLRNENNTNEIILKGLKAQRMQSGEQRYFKSELNNGIQLVKDGWDVLRQDGITATVIFSGNHVFCYIRIFVWHPQCVTDLEGETFF